MPASGRICRGFAIALAAILLGTPARAYYHYIHYLSQNAPYTPIPAAFDLNALPNKTVTFSVSDSGPAIYGSNDSFGSVLGQVKQAAAAWNSVASSDLRVAFGGVKSQNQTSNLPGGDVVFMDLGPGLLGMGGITTAVTPVIATGPNGPFLPIARGTVTLTNNTGTQPGPSYLESFYTTAVHEFGHALGLQHTWTSAAMSQDVIRNTSRARPVDADDIAAVSVLYGKAGWAASYGSISGRVTMNNQPVAMASVVAIPPTGPAVSALTDPGGGYTINGLPPNTYLLYVHPLPPDAIPSDNSGLVLPADLNGRPFPAASGAFETVFYPGTLDPQQATTFTVTGGTVVAGKDFAVQPRPAVPVYNVVTYSFLDPAAGTYTWSGTLATTPAYVDVTKSMLTVVAQANSGQTPAPASVSILGSASALVQPHPQSVALYFNIPQNLASGPRHLVFNFGDDMYVLPDGINFVQKAPPQAGSVIPNPEGSVTIAGSGLGPDSRVFFDGLQAAVQTPFSKTENQGSITVVPPAGVSGQTSTITVFDSDGQNSMFWQPANPPVYTYPASAQPQIANLSLTSLPAGVSAEVDITGQNTNFVDGQVAVGFGSDDVTVRRVWARSPTHLMANVVVAPNAAAGFSEVSVISGFQVLSLPAAFQVQPANPALPSIALPLWNGASTQLYPGIVASIYGSNLALSPTSAQLTLNDVPVATQFVSATQINFVIPAGFPTGSAILKLNNGSVSAFPVALQIDSPPPAITGVVNASNVSLDATHPANPGDVLNVLVSGLDPAAAANPGRLQVTVSGVPMIVQQVTAADGGGFQIQFTLTRSFGSSQVPVVVSVDGSASAPFTITAG